MYQALEIMSVVVTYIVAIVLRFSLLYLLIILKPAGMQKINWAIINLYTGENNNETYFIEDTFSN